MAIIPGYVSNGFNESSGTMSLATSPLTVFPGNTIYVQIGMYHTSPLGQPTVTDNLEGGTGYYEQLVTGNFDDFFLWVFRRVGPVEANSTSFQVTVTPANAHAPIEIMAVAIENDGGVDEVGTSMSNSGVMSETASISTESQNDMVLFFGIDNQAGFVSYPSDQTGMTYGTPPPSLQIWGSYQFQGTAGSASSTRHTAANATYVCVDIAILPATPWTAISSRPFITVSPLGTTTTPATQLQNNGADFGPDTPGTQSWGIQEALDSLGETGGHIYLLPGTFIVTAPSGIQWPNANGIILEGSGSVMTTVSSGSATLITDASGIGLTGCGVINNKYSTCAVWRNFSVFAQVAQYAVYWYYEDYLAIGDTSILELFENVEASSSLKASGTNYGWYLVGFEQVAFVSCGNGFSFYGESVPSLWGVYVECPDGDARFFGCDFQGSMALKTQESNLYETTVEQGVTCVLGRFYMFGGALYDTAGTTTGEPPAGPCLYCREVTRCIGVIFNSQNQTGSGPYSVVVNQGGRGTNNSPYSGGANAQANVFESCIFNMLWASSAPSYVIATSPGNLSYSLRVLRECQFDCGPSYTGLATVLQNSGYAMVENCIYFCNGSNPAIVPPAAGSTISPNPPTSTPTANANLVAIEIYLPVTYNPTTFVSAQLTPYLGPSSSPSALPTEVQPAAGQTGVTRTYRLRVPAGWYYAFSGSNVSIGTATIIEM